MMKLASSSAARATDTGSRTPTHRSWSSGDLGRGRQAEAGGRRLAAQVAGHLDQVVAEALPLLLDVEAEVVDLARAALSDGEQRPVLQEQVEQQHPLGGAQRRVEDEDLDPGGEADPLGLARQPGHEQLGVGEPGVEVGRERMKWCSASQTES